VQRQLRNLGLISGAIKRGSTVRPPKNKWVRRKKCSSMCNA
jgi:hypothetical protein